MGAPKLSFTNKTQERMKKDMSIREKGRVLFARLQELEADGTLSKAKTRADVARLVGYSEERAKAGYAWVSNLIRRGHIRETILEWTPSGKMITEYHTTGSTPDYGYEEVNRRRAKKEAGQQTSQWPEPSVIERARVSNPIKIEITRGDISIKVEIDGYEQANKLITALMKGGEE